MENDAASMPPLYTPPVGAPGAPASPNSAVSGNAIKPAKPPKTSKPESSLLKVVIIILLSLLLVGASLLALYFYTEYRSAATEVEAAVKSAVLDAVKAREDELETEFAEREKKPNWIFTGPEDYGSLSFEYPKTWSVYINKSASSGGNFEAYLHPREVTSISASTIYALRVTIENSSFETVANRYASAVKKGNVSSSIISVNGADTTRYDGSFNKNFVGSVVIFKIRDKTVTLESDAEIYREDFNKILETVTYNS